MSETESTCAVSLGQFQDTFATALLRYDALHPTPEPGEHIYRNNVTHSLVEALGKQFPAVKGLVGAEFFMALAREYVQVHLPEVPALTFYGDRFPAFVKGHPACHSLPWLADVARLEYLCQQSLHAGDDAVLDPAELSCVCQEDLPAVRLRLRSSTALMQSDWPVHLVRREALSSSPQQVNLGSSNESCLLVYRKHWQVEVQQLTPAVWNFLWSLHEGGSIAESWEETQQLCPVDDDALAAVLGGLLSLPVFSSHSVPRNPTGGENPKEVPL